MSAITTEKKACMSERCVIVGVTLYTELRRATVLLCCLPFVYGMTEHMHDTLDWYTERDLFISCPPRRDSTRSPPQLLQRLLCCVLFVFADICFAHGSSDGRVYIRASLAREVSASPIVRTRVSVSSLGHSVPSWTFRFPFQGTASSHISRSDAWRGRLLPLCTSSLL
jgi:hypothetical protein